MLTLCFSELGVGRIREEKSGRSTRMRTEQHIRKKTRKPNALSFWVGGGVILLYVGSVLIFMRFPRLCPFSFSQ